MENFDPVAVTKTCNKLYRTIFNAIGLLAPSATTRYYICVDLENGHDYFKTSLDDYKFHFMKLWEFRKQAKEAMVNPWVSEVVNRAISYRKKSPDRLSTFLEEAQERLENFEGFYRRLWENLDCPESMRPNTEKVNEDRRIWRVFKNDQDFESLSLGLRYELAAIKRVITEQRSVLAGLAERTDVQPVATKKANSRKSPKKAGRKPVDKLFKTKDERKIWQLHKDKSQSAAIIASNLSINQEDVQRTLNAISKRKKRITERKKSDASTDC